MALEDKTATLTIRGTTQGLDQALAQLSKLGVSYEQTARVMDQRVPALEKLAQKYNDVYRAEQQYIANQEKLKRAADAYAQTTGNATKAQELLAIGLAGLKEKHDAAGKGAAGHGAASGQAAMRMMELAHAGRSVTDMMMAGVSPVRAFTQEGVRLAGVMGATGGLGASLGIVGAGILAIGVTAAVTVGHAMELNAQLRALNATSIAYGNQAFGASQLQGMAFSGAASSSFGRADMVSAMQELERFRTLSASTTQGIAGATAPFAEATSQKPAEAAKQLAEAMKGGYDGIMKLNSAYGFLNPAEAQHVLNLSMQGKGAEAARVALDAFTAQMDKAALASRTAGESAAISFGNAWSTALDSVVKSDGFKELQKFFGIAATGAALSLSLMTGAQTPLDAAGATMRQRADERDAAAKIAARNPNSYPEQAKLAAAQARYEAAQVEFARLRDSEIAARAANENQIAQQVGAAAAKAEETIGDAKKIAAQKQSAFYFGGPGMAGRAAVAGLYGPAKERAAIGQEYSEAMLSAGDDPEAQGKAEADRAGKLAVLAATEKAATDQRIRDLGLEAQAQRDLSAAVGDYTKTVKARIDAEVAQWSAQHGEGQGERLRPELEAKAQAALAADQAKAFQGLRDEIQQATEAADRALGRGLGRGGSKVAPEALAGQMAREKGYDYGTALDLETQLRTQQERGRRITEASKYSPGMAYDAAVKQIQDVRANLGQLGLTERQQIEIEQQLTQATIDANIKRLEASRNWSDGAEAALRKYANDATNYGKQAGDAITAGLKGAEDALMSLSKGTQKPIDALKAIGFSVAQSLQRSVIQQGLGSIAGGVASLFGADPTGASASDKMGAAASTFQSAVQTFAASVGYSGAGTAGGSGNPMAAGGGSWTAAGGNGGGFGALGNLWGSLSGNYGGQQFYGGMFGGASTEALGAGTDVFSMEAGAGTEGMMSEVLAFAGGTDSAPAGFAMVGEQGPELVQFGGGERVYPNDQTSALMQPPAAANSNVYGGHTINIHAPGATKEDATAIANEVATRISNRHWAERGPALASQATNQALSKHIDLSNRAGRYARASRGQ